MHMQTFFGQAGSELEAGRDLTLCVVIAVSGSVPRAAGAMMAVRPDGTSFGTIGGGAVEAAVVREATQNPTRDLIRLSSHVLAPNAVADLGMVCGGTVRICSRRLRSGRPTEAALMLAAADACAAGQDAWLAIRLESGALALFGAGTLLLAASDGESDRCADDARIPSMLRETARLDEAGSGLFAAPISRRGTVFVFGGGHVAQEVVPAAAKVGFRPVVVDDREAYADPALFPQAAAAILADFSSVGDHVVLTESDCAVVVTRAHEADFEVLRQVLATPAGYVGMIGSARKIAVTKDRLRQAGFAEEDLARIHAPIGLPIGADTPAEIAVSIVAELILHRSDRRAAGR